MIQTLFVIMADLKEPAGLLGRTTIVDEENFGGFPGRNPGTYYFSTGRPPLSHAGMFPSILRIRAKPAS